MLIIRVNGRCIIRLRLLKWNKILIRFLIFSQLLHIIVMKMNFCFVIWGWFTAFSRCQFVERYSHYNSTLQPRIGQNSNVLVSSSAFDSQGNLWVSNPYTNSPLSVYSEGEWQSFLWKPSCR